jgi:hypothetical protein
MMLLGFVCLIAASAAVPPADAVRTAVTGVWKPADLPGLYIFTAKHFSRMSVLGGEPRPRFKSSNPADATAAEKIAAYDTLFANTGTYEIAGDTITFHSILAKSPNSSGVAGRFAKMRFKIEGNTLTFTHPLDTAESLTLTRVE